ncbi:MAG TPA: M20/M25/M40 family metallo-hydrolase [Parvularculaceae bacterium]|nr:M20/M25/M40 family metallo-hydrolase [Amphiplicatus sp.]MCB9956065.1 M20/M25/M40 family metallo-hydrolase [Caulobacterales bacterium]HOP18495.1 M20/M25/M40 family metallo-hydrolase [Amphiplicatus sp.]HPE32133.1 M20/M25/M40 family metallo-hydrolase [Parvularculaceae bacterium]HRX39811.1 M20/M25/M40 family metallo-hydrolase [Parvularculaceae bacterium]
MKKLSVLLPAGVLLIVAIVALRTLMLPAGSPPTESKASEATDTSLGMETAARLSRAIQFQTVSWGGERGPDADAFEGFSAYLEDAYPAAHHAMTREIINGHSLLYRWAGANPNAKPIAFIAHIDVVPVEPGTESGWTAPPFAGEIEDGAVWGRGALDNKGQLISIMEAVEKLAASGFKPSRDIYLLFGHDEELGGENGAAMIAKTLAERGVHFEWTLDEGSGLVAGLVPGVERPLALISTAEKGSTTLHITAKAAGGHSSAPGKDTAVSLVARAVARVTDEPYPLEIDADMVAFLHAVAGEMPFVPRALLANLWLTAPIIKKQLGEDPTTAAALRTTTAATMINGGAKVNILPQHADAYVNYRIHPRDTAASVLDRAISIIDDENVEIEAVGARDPSPQSSTRSDGYRAIAEATADVFGAVPTSPFLTLQGTDTRNYIGLADDYYRFTPFIYHKDDLKRIHGTDERVLIEDLVRASAWYEALIRKTAS